jgi:hypothetical protein
MLIPSYMDYQQSPNGAMPQNYFPPPPTGDYGGYYGQPGQGYLGVPGQPMMQQGQGVPVGYDNRMMMGMGAHPQTR